MAEKKKTPQKRKSQGQSGKTGARNNTERTAAQKQVAAIVLFCVALFGLCITFKMGFSAVSCFFHLAGVVGCGEEEARSGAAAWRRLLCTLRVQAPVFLGGDGASVVPRLDLAGTN